jgi:hypothetical protein
MSDKKIPGIYNYCDRWCERCSFGSRCAVYEGEAGLAPGEKDDNNKAFWERLAINFSKARDLLERAAAERGIDLDEIVKENSDYEQKEQQKRIQAESHPLPKLSLRYLTLARKWMDVQPGMKEKLENIQQQLDLGGESFVEAKSTTDTILDSLAVIQWYQTFIHVKFMSALMSKAVDDDDGDDKDDAQRDHDGSAKVGVIAIERSMQAWVKLYELLPDQEDHFLKILALLEKLRGMAVEEFPLAMAFKRPGFDD